MSGLRDKLVRMKSPSAQAKPAAPAEAQGNAQDAWSAMQAQIVSNETGSFVRRKIDYPFEFSHGRYKLGELPENIAHLSPLLAGSESFSAESLLFFDTETTGLGIGAGNVPFMIGIGYYSGDGFVVEQLLIRNPAEEAAMLRYLDEKIGSTRVVVSYNGRTFDWPILSNRYVLHRMRTPSTEIRQLDLLYPSRGLWKHTMESCRLGKVEETRLGIVRQEDVPGAMAPVYYFQYLSSGDHRLLEGVFHHNEIDILSLAALANHFCMLLGGLADHRDLPAAEGFRTALWLEKYGKEQDAMAVIEQLLSQRDERLRGFIVPLAAHLKKKGRIEAAVRLWERSVVGGSGSMPVPVEPLIELAMYHEHKKRDVERALYYAEQARAAVKRRLGLTRVAQRLERLLSEIEYRIERLKRKRSSQLPSLF